MDGCPDAPGRGPRPGRRDSDRNSATVWSLWAIAVLLVVFGAVLALGQAVVIRHRAAGGADLAALAAADHWAEGGAAACARAEELAAAQGARLVRCAIVGDTSEVTAAVGRGPFAAEVGARAGPAGPAGPVPAAAAPGVPYAAPSARPGPVAVPDGSVDAGGRIQADDPGPMTPGR
ncbi:Rv3654c family TadE-like protein [Streptomyces sp. NPDC015171]|uniref:Rv3654c family TadE-like protein n=1 Tax=Streptomyces sp. NPDC015171 TaxID=3364945 RepID=UPI0036F69B1C